MYEKQLKLTMKNGAGSGERYVVRDIFVTRDLRMEISTVTALLIIVLADFCFGRIFNQLVSLRNRYKMILHKLKYS